MSGGGADLRWLVVVVLPADGDESRGELFADEGERFGIGGEEEFFQQRCGERSGRIGGERRGERGVGRRERKGDLAGLGGHVHVLIKILL